MCSKMFRDSSWLACGRAFLEHSKMQAHSPPSGHVHTGAGATWRDLLNELLNPWWIGSEKGQDFFLGLWHVMAMRLWVNMSSWCAAGANVAGEVQIWRRWPGGPLTIFAGLLYTRNMYTYIYIYIIIRLYTCLHTYNCSQLHAYLSTYNI